MEGGAFRDGLGCRGEGGIGPTLVWYLRGARAVATKAWEAAAPSVEPMAGLPWAAAWAVAAVGGGTAAVAVVVVGEGAATAAADPELDSPIGGGEERCTRGLELCPLRVFTMAGLEKERRWRGWE